MQSRVLLARVARIPRDGEPSVLPKDYLVLSLRHGRLVLAPYAKGRRTMEVLFRPWRRMGSGGCLPTPLPGMACLLLSWSLS